MDLFENYMLHKKFATKKELQEMLKNATLGPMVQYPPNPDIRVINHGMTHWLHRNILIAGSTTFNRILTDGRIKIMVLYVNELSKQVFAIMVHFLYHGFLSKKIKDINLAVEVYVCGSRYGIPGLVTEARKFIAQLISRRSVLGIFSKSLEYFDNELKVIVENYCDNNPKEIPVNFYALMGDAEKLLESRFMELKRLNEKRKDDEEKFKKKEIQEKIKTKKK